MNVTVIGGGAAGLGAAISIKKRLDADVTVFERANEGESPGLGIALLPFGLKELEAMQLDGFAAFAESCFPIGNVVQVFAGQTDGGELVRQARIQETPYWGVKRSRLLAFLRAAAPQLGVRIEYGADISEERIGREKARADLVVGADGAGSLVRNLYADIFGPESEDATSRFAWLELEGNLDQFIFGYIYIAGCGLVRVTAYPHGNGEASAVVTHSPELTDYFDAAPFIDGDGVISPDGLHHINQLFAEGLGGRTLGGESRWRRFRATRNRRAAFANVALVGDAYATVHYETGWGTSSALQESRILAHILDRSIKGGQSIADALEIYDRKARDIFAGLTDAATSTMRDVDGQAAKFRDRGPAGFLQLKTS